MGGLLILVSETMFLFSMLNFLLVTRIQYYNPGDPYMRQLLPHYLVFLAALASAALVVKGPCVRLYPAKQDGILPAAGGEGRPQSNLQPAHGGAQGTNRIEARGGQDARLEGRQDGSTGSTTSSNPIGMLA